jgi:2-oxo-4-hydroxy-4-carboxy--5-ureidoimidazoline (OHCU) decarboxylase
VVAATLDEQLGLIAPTRTGRQGGRRRPADGRIDREQAKSGLHLCSREFATLHRLNADYNAKFGFPFILAVKGPTGKA